MPLGAQKSHLAGLGKIEPAGHWLLRQTRHAHLAGDGNDEARDLLGHANISQISTDLLSTAKARGLAIERRKSTSDSLQTRADAHRRKVPTRMSNVTIRCRLVRVRIRRSGEALRGVGSWLGGRDSNPDNVVQRLGERGNAARSGHLLRARRAERAFASAARSRIPTNCHMAVWNVDVEARACQSAT